MKLTCSALGGKCLGREEIVALLAVRGGWVTARFISQSLGCTIRAVYEALDSALKAGDIEQRESGIAPNYRPIKEYKIKTEEHQYVK